jgi:outer membrane protein OmpA-like peptidoglycan-associated protein
MGKGRFMGGLARSFGFYHVRLGSSSVAGKHGNRPGAANLAAMANSISKTDHIALYGNYFDTDKAVIKPESRPTLEQIAKLLTSQPQLNVFIVGHTDNQGAYDYNLDLSRRRAEAIAAEL